jgi:hypothetical protein
MCEDTKNIVSLHFLFMPFVVGGSGNCKSCGVIDHNNICLFLVYLFFLALKVRICGDSLLYEPSKLLASTEDPLISELAT